MRLHPMRLQLALVTAVWLLAPLAAEANVKPHALCSDGMVLQQKSKVKIWGTADPGEEVTVTFRDGKATATADPKGNWVVTLEAGAAGGPLPMTIAGKNTLNYKDVYVGEVWVCSGQSNMEWTVAMCDSSDQSAAKSAPANSKLRIFTVGKTPQYKPASNVTGKWTEAAPNTVMGFSAVGYFFGRDLQNALKVPVGMISTSWGGTRAEAWTSAPTLAAHPDYKAEYANYTKAKEDTAQKTGKLAIGPNDPAALYNGMIHPILNYTIKGAIWYQGESNAGKAYHYRTLFPLMIQNWRADWKQGDFPFYFVQLAPFYRVSPNPGESNWAELREAQLLTLKTPHTGMAVITDYGNEYDIHPTPKKPVGERLSLIARAKDYGEKVAYSGPVFESMKVEGNKAVLTFSHTGGGLVAREMVPTLERKNGAAWRVKEGSKTTSVTGFTIAGADKKFHNAKADIVGNTVVVSADEVSAPVAVRFGWSNHPVVNLFNVEGLPASPFRTDEFPVSTQPKK